MTADLRERSRSSTPADAASGRSTRMGDEAVVVSATGVVSVLNYAYTLVLLWVLPTREFAEAGSISALLLICGTIAGAALPWVLAQEVLRSGPDRARRRMAVSFCLFATVLQGAGAGLATCLIVMHYARGWVLPAAFAAAFMIFMGATATGFFQGQQRFRLIAVLKVSEVVVKLGTGVALIALGAGASGAIAGFAIGATVVVVVGVAAMARDIQWSWAAVAGRHLWASTQGLLAIQAGVAVLASMDVVIGSLVLGASPALASYQAANIFGRIPVFIGAALSIVAFPRMIAARRPPAAVIRESVMLYATLCVPVALVIATMPSFLVHTLFPGRYGDVGSILPWSALAGLGMGAVNLTTTYFQAAGKFRRTSSLLIFGVALCAGLEVFGLRLGGVVGLAVAVTIGGAVVTALLLREVARVWPGALVGTWRPTALVVAGCLPLAFLRSHLVAWCLWALGCALVFCLRSLLRLTSGGDGPSGPHRPRVLHLGYEDPRRPGAGGGSVRTHEINRRLADTFEITVVCARFRGARPRLEDGVRYVHIGLAGADFPERLAYFALLPWALLRYPSDLVVEDFGAPFSSVAVPWMTGRPVIGVVQWLFAREKSAQYHLPFHWVEELGVRSHRALIAVSDDLGSSLAERNPRAEVTVVANGLDSGAFHHYDRRRAGIAYLGRLEIAQKGLDLLIEAYAEIAGSIEQDLVLGGDGPDRQALTVMAQRLGVADRVHFVGRVAAEERFAWLAGADVVAMPSRYETFGMVAAEALAVGTPVVAFDIPCLRALVDDEVGARVPAFEVGAFADKLRSVATDADLRHRLGRAGPLRVGGLRWEGLAQLQGAVYRRSIGTPVGAEVRAAHPPDPVVDGASPSVVRRLADQRAATPERIAVVDGDVRWTYDQLHRAAHSVTGALARQTLGPGHTIGVCLPRSKEAIAAMLGIWMAGATYLPLDPDYPPSRLAELCRQAGVDLVVGGPARLDSVDPPVPHLDAALITDVGPDPKGNELTRAEPKPTDLAYILFTSGSSGRPKGVKVAHRSLSSVLDWIHTALGPDELAVTTTSISFSFDPFILEVLGPLTIGGRVHVIPTALAIGDLETEATMVANTPSVLGELFRAGRLPDTLKTVIVGGEVLPPDLARDLLSADRPPRLINTYGPTEATVLATAAEIALPADGPVAIGRDLPGARVVILDEQLRPVGRGEQGEICIHGPQLALGYLDDPSAEAERFVPWTGADGLLVRIYRTGDIGRRDRHGVLHFCGRSDRQLKVRGFRVEPGEIEAVLARHPAVAQAVVTGVGAGHGARLVAYVTTHSSGAAPSELKAWLTARLPRYLVPDRFVVMESFPVTANGKVAMDRLPDWQPLPSGPPLPDPGPAEDGSDPVVVVARLARTILDYHGPITGDDDVLEDLGGTSLALFQLLTAIEQEFSCRIEIGRILADTTVAGLAALARGRPEMKSLPTVEAETFRRPVYMIHAYLGTALNYRRLGPYLGEDRPLVGIQVQEFGDATRPVRTSIEEMAAEAVAQIRSRQGHGPYVLGGHSAGGLVAYEAARLLSAAGDAVPLVVLLDSPVPRSSLHYLWAEAVLNWPDIRVADATERVQQVRGALFRRFGHLRLHPDPDRVRAAITHSYRAINLAVKRYHPGPYDGDVAVLRTKQGAAMALGKIDLGWGGLVRGRLVSIEIPGLHNTILEGPQLEVVGRQLDQLVAGIGGATPPEPPPATFLPPPFLRRRQVPAGRRRSA